MLEIFKHFPRAELVRKYFSMMKMKMKGLDELDMTHHFPSTMVMQQDQAMEIMLP